MRCPYTTIQQLRLLQRRLSEQHRFANFNVQVKGDEPLRIQNFSENLLHVFRIFTKFCKILSKFDENSSEFHQNFTRICSDVLHPLLISDASGCFRMLLDAFGCFPMLPDAS